MYTNIEATQKADTSPLLIIKKTNLNKKVYKDIPKHSIKQETYERGVMQEESGDFVVNLHFTEQGADVREVLSILKNVYIKHYLDKRSSEKHEKSNLSLSSEYKETDK